VASSFEILSSSVAIALLIAACSSSSSSPAAPAPDPDSGSADPIDSGGTLDASDGASPADAGLTGKCADTFGASLTTGFGRIDGIVYAVQKPSDTQCVMPNSDHVVLQVLMSGAVYRMVINVSGSGADPKIRYQKIAHALPAPAFAEGWHAAAPLDYVTTLGVHTTDAAFTAYDLAPLVTELASELHVGDPISVYATVGTGRPESAHLVHRNKTDEDGAVVLAPSSASPSMLVFHFADQTF
jgi:hypothetical protein